MQESKCSGKLDQLLMQQVRRSWNRNANSGS